jgi:periplasmic protein CpxP/Spy
MKDAMTMKTIRTMILLAGAAALASAPLGAQDSTRGMDRDALQRRFQERFGAMIKERLQLSDSQVVRLQATNRRFEEQRRLLIQQERDVRMSLRDELLGEAQGRPNQERIGSLLDRAIGVQRQRVELLEAEQRELARFLNPTQRAKLLGMQEQLRRSAGELRRGPEGARERLRQRMRDSGPPGAGRRPLRRPPGEI